MNKYVFAKALLVLICASVVLLGSCAGDSRVSQPQSGLRTQHRPTISREPEVSVYETAKKDLLSWPNRLWTDSKTTFTRPDNITALLLAGGASVAMHQETDEKIADYFAEHRVFHDWKDETLNVIGSPTTQLAASSIWYFFSARSHDTLNRQRAWTMRTALTISWLTTWGLKLARNNESPNGEDWSWPSGHAASSFTAASVLYEFYGHKIGIPAYAIASLVSWRMMDTGDHWGSDIVFGATLGWVVGHTVAGQNRDLTIAGFEVVPFVPVSERPAMGIGLMKRF
jgi:hypothetical protein